MDGCHELFQRRGGSVKLGDGTVRGMRRHRNGEKENEEGSSGGCEALFLAQVCEGWGWM
jgi:hypothetical protein